MKILIVSAFPTITRLLESMLADLGFRGAETAAGSDAALRKIRSGKFRLVLCDRELAPDSGLDLLEKVRAEARNANLLFVLMFADSSAEKIDEAYTGGADGCLVKPFDITAVSSAIACALSTADA
ncbi:MAG: response regulator [Alphaproteobacteria bacterium]|nr:response regulator [Alphaproteobacteria bacterium]